MGKRDDLHIHEFIKKYGIHDSNVILRLISLRESIKIKRHVSISNDELISFLECAMNYNDMQIWLIRMELQEIEITLNDMLMKFFELKTDDDIIRLYDIQQNYDQNNIDNIKKL